MIACASFDMYQHMWRGPRPRTSEELLGCACLHRAVLQLNGFVNYCWMQPLTSTLCWSALYYMYVMFCLLPRTRFTYPCIFKSMRFFVGGLVPEVDDNDLRQEFGKYGDLEEATRLCYTQNAGRESYASGMLTKSGLRYLWLWFGAWVLVRDSSTWIQEQIHGIISTDPRKRLL